MFARLCAAALALSLLLAAGPGGAQVAQKPLVRIAFGSCADQTLPQPIWDAVLAYRPQLFIFGGDNVYGDVTTADLRDLRTAYATARIVPGMARLRQSVPHLAVWDDHDYGVNDGGGEVRFKAESKALFMDFWELAADDPRRSRDGLYHAVTIGPPGKRVQVILLDTRWFRSPLKPTDQRDAPGKERYLPDPDPAKTMLGSAQWAWLEERLREPAELRLVVSSIQVVAEGHGFERWGNLPAERQRLLDLIRRTEAAGVVLLSGDRHLAALYRESAGTPYPLVEITSSSLNRPYHGSREPGPNRLGGVYGDTNFGTVDIDWWEGTVTLAVRDEAGQAVRRTAVRLEELRPR
ncbi:MAG: alkaline phosphatase family protein [Alphaproteobacteria bacterium]|nr:alkaline phosphatase family protein [Alphaproteobacteria bacterium]